MDPGATILHGAHHWNRAVPGQGQTRIYIRAWKSRDASGQWTKQEFDARGFASQTCASTAADNTPTCGSSFYTAVEQVDARGAVTLERRGSSTGPTISRSYNALNGQLVGVCTGTGCTVQNALYDYDNKGQIIRREQAGRYAERFQYDAADRLTLGWFESLGGTYYGTSAPSFQSGGQPHTSP